MKLHIILLMACLVSVPSVAAEDAPCGSCDDESGVTWIADPSGCDLVGYKLDTSVLILPITPHFNLECITG